MFKIGDHVENVPATVDGIVYRVRGADVWFCDEYVVYRVGAGGIRPRYEPFDWETERRIKQAHPGLFRKDAGMAEDADYDSRWAEAARLAEDAGA